MVDPQAIKHDFSRAAPGYDAHAALQRDVRKHCIALAKDRWPGGAHILDAGCGTGALARETTDWRITGLDLAFGMCAQANHAVNADAHAMPFADASFDGVFSSLMLQWANALPVFREMQRVTKPGGSAVIATFIDGTLRELRESFAAIDDAPHISDFSPAPELLLRAVHAGFCVVSTEEKIITEHYPDAMSLMRALKAIGATNKQEDRRKGLMSPAQLARLEETYSARFKTPQGLPATWKLLYMVLEKMS